MSPESARKRFPIGLEKLDAASTPRRSSDRTLRQAMQSSALVGAPTAPGRRSASSPGVLALRQRMVARLAGEGAHRHVLEAMEQVPRHLFVDSGLEAQAYEDVALPIGLGQTISSPSVVARMASLLLAGGRARGSGSLGRVLEVGTGCGYQAALLSLLGTSVISVERLRALHEAARDNLSRVDVRRQSLRLVLADGRLGHPPNAPYDSIVAAAAGDSIPLAWIEQLADGGRLVAPQGAGANQVLVVIDRGEHGITRTEHEAVRFVPLEFGVVVHAGSKRG